MFVLLTGVFRGGESNGLVYFVANSMARLLSDLLGHFLAHKQKRYILGKWMSKLLHFYRAPRGVHLQARPPFILLLDHVIQTMG